MAKANSGGWLENLKTIVYAVLIAVVIRTVGFEPFHIPSGSMIPTLLVGDYLFVSKYSYGFSRYSMPFSPDLFSGRIFGSLPKRGDVVVFKNMHADYEDYIKRIIGLPGDHIQVRAGLLYINGTPVGIRPVGDVRVSSDYGTFMDEKEYVETLPGNVSHLIAKMGSEGPQNNTPEYVVPAGNLFAMGDNRDNSLDSRFSGDSPDPGLRQSQGVGYLPVENLVGRAQFIFFSIDATEPVWQVWQWPFEIRWSRLLTGIR
jgi:signal peptidase I